MVGSVDQNMVLLTFNDAALRFTAVSPITLSWRLALAYAHFALHREIGTGSSLGKCADYLSDVCDVVWECHWLILIGMSATSSPKYSSSSKVTKSSNLVAILFLCNFSLLTDSSKCTDEFSFWGRPLPPLFRSVLPPSLLLIITCCTCMLRRDRVSSFTCALLERPNQGWLLHRNINWLWIFPFLTSFVQCHAWTFVLYFVLHWFLLSYLLRVGHGIKFIYSLLFRIMAAFRFPMFAFLFFCFWFSSPAPPFLLQAKAVHC